MRTKKEYIIITFKTTTSAMAMEKQCRQRKIPGRIIPLPAQVSAGCGLSFRMSPEEYDGWKEELALLEVPFEGVYRIIM